MSLGQLDALDAYISCAGRKKSFHGVVGKEMSRFAEVSPDEIN